LAIKVLEDCLSGLLALECGIVGVFRDRVKEVMVNVKGIASKEPRDKLDIVKLRVKHLRVNDKVAVNLGVLVNVFLLAYSNIFILSGELFRVSSNFTGGTA
jgi:hypothetical protein